MKQVLKPLGHCLTTAVMTSAMLRVYAVPTVEAAVPNSASSQPSAEEMLPAAESSLESASDPIPAAQAVSTPEVVDPIETPLPNPVLDQPKASNLGGDSGSLESPANKPEEPPLVNLSPIEPKNPPASPQKASSSTAPTVAGMRQTVEKRLAAIVEQDKTSRDEKWQQNLVISALQAAWRGEFAQARKIAAHPALPAALQTELLTKIAAVEAQLNPAQIAQQPNGKKLPSQQQGNAQRANAQQANLPQGRQVPSTSFSSVSPSIASYPSFGNQCPAIGATQSSTQPSAQATSTVKQTGKAGIPTFVPSLSENLAARLVQLSKTHSVATFGKPTNLKQAFVAPQLFVGVAARSIHAKPVVSPTRATVSAAVQPSHFQTKATPIQPKANASANVAPANAAPAAPNLFKSLNSTPDPGLSSASLSNSSTPKTDRLLATIDHLPLDQIIEQPSTPLAQPSASLTGHLEQAAVSFFHLIPDPLQQMWKWWAPGSSDSIDLGTRTDQLIGRQALPPLEQPTTSFNNGLPRENLTIAARAGLNDSLLQSWQLDLPAATPVAPIRSAYKFSALHFSTAKTTTAKLTQSTVLDANALLAASCARAQLANQFTDQVIDPVTSKLHGWVNLMFPLPIPAVVTSVFGWRTHPISGNLSFHTGLDLGAPMGTPVLAALEGQVVAADSMGGYGLAVVVENSKTQQRNLYGHLSGIAVQPGVHVTAGTVLGWVGSTGNSTGPHLHFESMIHTQSGWTAIDPLATAALASSRTQ